MRHVTIRKLHEETGRIVDEAGGGEVIVVERRGIAVAEIRGVSTRRRKAKVPDFGRRYRSFPRVTSDSARFQEEDRR